MDQVYIACERCHGEGYLEEDDDADGEGCRQCHGEGGWYRPREPLKPCEICGGKGSIPQEDEVEVVVRPGERRRNRLQQPPAAPHAAAADHDPPAAVIVWLPPLQACGAAT